MDVRENIKAVLNQKIKIEKVISQKDLASAVGITAASITKWLNGDQVPDVNNIPLVCKALGITLNEFFGVEDSITSDDLKLLRAYYEHKEHQASINTLLKIK